MMRALIGCGRCGFITRRHGMDPTLGACPNCKRPLEEISLSQAQAIAHRRRETELLWATAALRQLGSPRSSPGTLP
jgi:uncharacterized protein with PIN domain